MTKGGGKGKIDVMKMGLSKRGVWAPDLWSLHNEKSGKSGFEPQDFR
jgi:hypothetical protein